MKKVSLYLLPICSTIIFSQAHALNYIVKFKETEKAFSILEQKSFQSQSEIISELNMAVVNAKTASELKKFQNEIEYIEPDYPVHTTQATNDPLFEGSLQNFGLPQVWSKIKGSPNVVVAVVDSGIALNHEDLKNQIWVNSKEIPNNNKDDDKNGFVDDTHGWNFHSKTNNPNDDNNHGSHVAGIIGAEGNNKKGIAGVAYGVRLMAIKAIGKDGSGSTSNTVKGILYAANNGAHIINASFGSNNSSASQRDAIEYARKKNILFVAAAGNDGRNTDKKSHYPSGYDIDNIISVAATDKNKRLASFSNYGIKTADIGAPGVGIRSCTKSSYARLNGTSMAAPQVAGAAALLLSENPKMTYQEIKRRLFLGSGQQDREKLAQGGYLNLTPVF